MIASGGRAARASEAREDSLSGVSRPTPNTTTNTPTSGSLLDNETAPPVDRSARAPADPPTTPPPPPPDKPPTHTTPITLPPTPSTPPPPTNPRTPPPTHNNERYPCNLRNLRMNPVRVIQADPRNHERFEYE